MIIGFLVNITLSLSISHFFIFYLVIGDVEFRLSFVTVYLRLIVILTVSILEFMAFLVMLIIKFKRFYNTKLN